MTQTAPVKIQKEDISLLNFPNKSVSISLVKSTKLYLLAQKAVILGNRYKNKIKIIFSDATGSKVVETTLWHASKKHLVLKGGITIPFNRVEEVVL